jgi:hypothetical protein
MMQEQQELFEQWQWQLHGWIVTMQHQDPASQTTNNNYGNNKTTNVNTTTIITIGTTNKAVMTGCAVSFVYIVRDWNVRSQTMTIFMGSVVLMTPMYDKYRSQQRQIITVAKATGGQLLLLQPFFV